jgi:broad specificity phosphatase PhoE
LRFPTVWVEFVSWLRDWKSELDDFPEIDLDASPRESFEDIKSIRPHFWRKLISNEQIWADGIIRVLFSNGTTLRLLFGHFSKQKSDEYQSLANSLLERIDRYY